jgi:membrane fusion protein (multidrug efflux system)
MLRFLSWVLALACLVVGLGAVALYRPDVVPAQAKPYLAEPRVVAALDLIKRGLMAVGAPDPAAVKPVAAPAAAPAGQRGQGAAAAAGGGPRPVAVEAVKVKVGLVQSSLTAVGSLRADESVNIAPEVDGRISDVTPKEGMLVEQGEVLFRLDDVMAKAELTQYRADLSLAETNFDRAETLFKQRSGTEKTRDEAKFALERTRANVEMSASRLDKTQIRAPFSGLLGLRAVSNGEYVTKGTKLISLSKVDTLKVDFRLPEVELASVATGNKVNIEVDALPGRKFEGTVFAIDPQVDVNGRSIALRATVANPGAVLKPGLFARVELITMSRPNAITVPETALVTQGRDRSIYVVRDGKAVRVKVAIGLREPGRVEIIEGLKPDDVVVVTGQQRLREGVPVDIVGTGPTS